jgi:hypothetical protein
VTLLSEVILFILIGSSTATVLAGAELLDKPKRWILSKVKSKFLEYFLTCSMCVGFWVGQLFYIYGNYNFHNGMLDVIFAGFLCSAFSALLDRLIYREYQNKNKNKEK